MNINKVKSASKNFSYNIIAALLINMTAQIVVYPVLAGRFSQEAYGVILTIMGIVNAIGLSLGNTLNNVRLIMDTEYKEKRLVGDYNLLLLVGVLLADVVVGIVVRIFFGQELLNVLMIVCYLSMVIFRIYHCVQFRISLDFGRLLLANVFCSVGFCLGSVLLSVIPVWTFPFLLSEAFGFLYLLCRSHYYREGYGVTPLFGKTVYKSGVLVVTNLVNYAMTYLDRLIIFPMVGSEAVSSYTVASVLGKTLGLVMGPAAEVLLVYYSKKNFKMSRKLLWRINGITFLMSAAFFGALYVMAPPVLSFLYPQIYPYAEPYLLLANLAAAVNVAGLMTQSAVLKFAPTWLQLVKEGAYSAIFVIAGTLLLESYGLMGFCMAALLANIVRLLLLYIIGSIYVGREMSESEEADRKN